MPKKPGYSHFVEEIESSAMGDMTTTSITILPDGRMDVLNAARYIGLAKKTLDMWRTAGKGPRFTKLSNRVFYRKVELDAWIDRHDSCVSTAQARVLKQMDNQQTTKG